jgi:predicted nuclease with TOPRIM domain
MPTSAIVSELSGTALAGLLAAQRDIYHRLAELACQQSGHVAAGEAEELMSVLGARAHLIDELTQLDQQIKPYKPRWQELLATLGAAQRAQISDLLAQVEKLLAQILAQDEADKEALVRQKSEIGAQLQGTVTGKQLNRAYGIRPKAPTPGLGLG